MKVPIGLAVSWALYGIGHVISLLMNYGPLWRLYPAYNRVMLASSDVQKWAGCDGPWVDE